jgi:PEGA domain-containing protein
MKVKHFAVPLALSLALALSSQPVLAQHRGGGGHGGGGGGSHGGYSSGHAVPRGGGGGGYHGGGSAGARHPQAGSGHYGYGHYHGSYYGHSHGYYGHSHGYYPYYGYGYGYPYYYGYGYPSFGLSFGWGWPSYYSTPYYGAGYGYGYAPSASMDYSAPPSSDYGDDPAPPPSREGERYAPPPGDRDSGSLRVEVRPEDTSIYVDDQFRGTAREARGLQLAPGRHVIELVRPGFVTEHREVEVARGERSDLLVEMRRK